MRVSFLLPGLHYGGVCRWALTLAKSFRSVQVESFISMGEGTHLTIEQEARRIAPVFTLPGLNEKGARRIDDEQRRTILKATRKADAVLFNAAGIMPQIMDSVKHAARIAVAHVTPQWTGQSQRVQTDARVATHWVAVSNAAAECFRDGAVVIESGAEVDRIAPAGTVDWGIPSIGKTALFVGRVSMAKGHHRLLDALHYLPPEWHVVFLGASGSHRDVEDIKVRALEEHPGRIILAPADTRIGAALAAASCLVVASDSEATPLVVLEAMLARLPIVSTEYKAIRDMMNQHGKIASVISQDASPQDLARAIQESQKDYVTVLNAWDVAWKNYTAASMAQRWERYLLAEIPKWQAEQVEPAKAKPISSSQAIERIDWKPSRGERPKVICLSHPLGNVGGPGTWLRSLVRRTEHAIDWGIVNISRDGRPDADILEDIGCPYWINDCGAMAEADLAIVWGLPGVRRLTAGFGGPMVCVSHGSGTLETAAWVRSVEQVCARRIGVSRDAAAYYTLPAEVIHNGVDIERLELPAAEEVVRAKTRQALGIKANEFAVGMVGRIARDKNPLAIAKACAYLPSRYRPVFVGPDESAGVLVNEIKAACPRSMFVSPTESVAEVYAALDCVAITSPREGFCLTAVEALHCGCPLLSTPVGVIPEIDEEFGQVAIPLPLDCNPAMIASAIRLTTRESPRIERGRQAAAHYTAERTAEKWLELIYDVLEWKHADCASA